MTAPVSQAARARAAATRAQAAANRLAHLVETLPNHPAADRLADLAADAATDARAADRDARKAAAAEAATDRFAHARACRFADDALACALVAERTVSRALAALDNP